MDEHLSKSHVMGWLERRALLARIDQLHSELRTLRNDVETTQIVTTDTADDFDKLMRSMVRADILIAVLFVLVGALAVFIAYTYRLQ